MTHDMRYSLGHIGTLAHAHFGLYASVSVVGSAHLDSLALSILLLLSICISANTHSLWISSVLLLRSTTLRCIVQRFPRRPLHSPATSCWPENS